MPALCGIEIDDLILRTDALRGILEIDTQLAPGCGVGRPRPRTLGRAAAHETMGTLVQEPRRTVLECAIIVRATLTRTHTNPQELLGELIPCLQHLLVSNWTLILCRCPFDEIQACMRGEEDWIEPDTDEETVRQLCWYWARRLIIQPAS
jgi:hypothetical protein